VRVLKEIFLGNEAVARGAYEAGVKVVSSYPGTPSTEITQAVSSYDRVYCEWSSNEKVGMEVAIGASLAGARAMTCMKHVGLNVAADPLFTVSYTGVSGGLVIVVADDPGMHSSQNEQDSRNYARGAKLPMLEPADSQECLDFTRMAYDISEKYDTPVMIRLSTRVSHSRTLTEIHEPMEQKLIPYVKNMQKNVMMPAMAVKRHVVVEARQKQIAADASEGVLGNAYRVEEGNKDIGIITSGIAWQYVKEAMPDASVFKLGMVWPLPLDAIRKFAATVKRLIIVEELDPIIETELKAAGIKCEGKELFTLQGEYTPAMIREALSDNKNPLSAFDKSALPLAPGRPPVMCAGCPHKGLFMALSRLKAVVTGDIGCYTLGALSPTNAMDVCVCMGASVGMAHGIDKATDSEMSEKTVAVIGDSTFLHTGINGLINSVYNGSRSTVIILDNSITGMTGHQQNPATGRNIRLEPAPAVDLEALCRSVGVQSVYTVDPADTDASRKTISQAMKEPHVTVVIARRPCALIPTGRGTPEQVVTLDRDKCTRCGACLRIMCPALTKGEDGYPQIDPVTCNGCNLCVRVCPFDALIPGKEEV
jgi:indolepyruvate ferredoxin oxidoreductase alpha subunit